MTTMIGNTVLKWWPMDIPILAIGIPHEEFITKYCPHARSQGIARLDGHRLVINHRGDLTITKVKRRPASSSMTSMMTAQPTGNSTSSRSAMLESPSLPKNPATNDTNAKSFSISSAISTTSPCSKRHSISRRRSRSTLAPFPTQVPGAWPEPNGTPTPAPISSTDLNNSATSFGSTSTTVSDSHPQLHNHGQAQHVENDLHTQVWGQVYLLTETQYASFQRQHLSHSQASQHGRPRQHSQPHPLLPRPLNIPKIFTRRIEEAQRCTTQRRRRRNLPEVQIHFFQHNLVQHSAARQAAFPETAGDALHRHMSEVRDMRLVRVLTRAGDDPDHVHDAIAEAVSETVTDFGEGTSAEEAREAAMATWRQQREKERREKMVRGLTQWSKDLLKQQVPEQWVREVVGGLIERVQGLEKGEPEREVDGEDGEEEVLGIESGSDEEEEEEEDREWDVEGQINGAMDNITTVVRGASREVMDLARRGVEALIAQFTREEDGEEEEWELVEWPDLGGR
ncbi:hypothetical protein B0T13DRAFT_512516 [Neurospora crassa]|nr:hypothetical protein B0T13DRAFT_512516 [Neurospora crassa]